MKKIIIDVPEDATNGDVIKALFPKAEITHDEFRRMTDIVGLDNGIITVESKWFDTKYGEGEEDE